MLTTQEKLKKIIESPVLWIETFLKISDKNGKIVPFKLNPQQKYLLKNLEKYNIICKSRQLGITSCSCAYSIYLASVYSNTTCLLMSYSIDSATGIFEKLKQLYYDLPKAIQVPLDANNKKELKFINGSRIIVCTCGNKDAARGLTLRFVHLSEVAFMKDTVDKQILAIEQALTPNGIMVLESTAQGLNSFSEMFFKAERKENMYRPFFFAFCDDKIMFAEEYEQFTERYINMHGAMPTMDELDETEKSLIEKGCSIQQICWRRLKIANSSEELFNQEFPSSATVAFVTSAGNNIFNPQAIHERLINIDSTPHIKICPNDLPVSLKCYFNRELHIWETPQQGMRYYAGVDTAEGLGGARDYSVIEVIDTEGFQCAEFRSNKIKPHVFAQIVNDLGIYYNKSLLVIEKASAGHVIADKLKNEYRYNRLYKHKGYDERGKAKHKIGFETNQKTKAIMINDFVELFEIGQLCINSEDLLKEMKLFMFKTDGKMEATRGNHDDTVMACAMAIQGLKHGIKYI